MKRASARLADQWRLERSQPHTYTCCSMATPPIQLFIPGINKISCTLANSRLGQPCWILIPQDAEGGLKMRGRPGGSDLMPR